VFVLEGFGSINPTKHNNLATGSVGCAPTPNQYFVRELSSRISLNFLGANFSPVTRNSGVSGLATGVWGIGLYVPRTSRGRLSRADLACATTML